MRKLHYLLAAVLMCCLLLSGCGNDTKEADAGGELTYEENASGEICITGITGPAEEVVIPPSIGGKPVTEIADKAFANRRGLKKLSIPASVSSIGDAAFYGCVNITIEAQVGSYALDYAIARSISFIPEITLGKEESMHAGVWGVFPEEGGDEPSMTVYINQDGSVLTYTSENGGTFCISTIYKCVLDDGGAYLYDSTSDSVKLSMSINDGIMTICGTDGTAYDLDRLDNSDGYSPLTLCAATMSAAAGPTPVSFEYLLDDSGRYAEITYASYTGDVREVFIPRSIDGYNVSAVWYSAFHNLKNCEYITIPEGITDLRKIDIGYSETVRNISFPDSVGYFEGFIDDGGSAEFSVGEKSFMHSVVIDTPFATHVYDADGQRISSAGVWKLDDISDGFGYSIPADKSGSYTEIVLSEGGTGAAFAADGTGSPITWRDTLSGVQVFCGETTYSFNKYDGRLVSENSSWADPAPKLPCVATYTRTGDVAAPEKLSGRQLNFAYDSQDESIDFLNASALVNFRGDGALECTVDTFGLVQTSAIGAWVMRGDSLYLMSDDASGQLSLVDYEITDDSFVLHGAADVEAASVTDVFPYDYASGSLARAFACTWRGMYEEDGVEYLRLLILRENGTGNYSLGDGLLSPQHIYASGTLTWKTDSDDLFISLEDGTAIEMQCYVIKSNGFGIFGDTLGQEYSRMPYFEGLVASAQKNANQHAAELSRSWISDSDFYTRLDLLPYGEARFYQGRLYTDEELWEMAGSTTPANGINRTNNELYWTLSKSGVRVWAKPFSELYTPNGSHEDALVYELKYTDGNLIADDGTVFLPDGEPYEQYVAQTVIVTPVPEFTEEPTEEPTAEPTEEPTAESTEEPTLEPTEEPTAEPTAEPTEEPTAEPTAEPTEEPTAEPTEEPSAEPTEEPVEDGISGFEYETIENGVVITLYTGDDSDVVVPNMISGMPVIAIGDNAFANCVRIARITLPESVVSIGNKAFFGCSSLVRIDMPDSIATIGKFVFNNSPDVVLYVTSGSYSDEYARSVGLKYEYTYAN